MTRTPVRCQGHAQGRSVVQRSTRVRRARFASAANWTATSTGPVVFAGRAHVDVERAQALDAHGPTAGGRRVERGGANTHLRARVFTCSDAGGDVCAPASDGHRRTEHIETRGPRPLRSRAALGNRGLDGCCGQPGGSVGALEARLEAGAQAVVAETEEAERRDVRIARRLADDLPVDRGLARLVGHGHVLEAAVADAPLRVDLPAHLVQVELQPVERRRLRRTVECVPERLLEPVEVREPGIRPLVAALEGIRRLVRIRMEAERVHEWLRAAAAPVPRAERTQEADGRRGDVVLGGRAVVPTRRETDADDRYVWIDALQRVVRRREVRAEARRRDVRSAASNCGRQNAGWFGSFPMTNWPPGGRSTRELPRTSRSATRSSDPPRARAADMGRRRARR